MCSWLTGAATRNCSLQTNWCKYCICSYRGRRFPQLLVEIQSERIFQKSWIEVERILQLCRDSCRGRCSRGKKLFQIRIRCCWSCWPGKLKIILIWVMVHDNCLEDYPAVTEVAAWEWVWLLHNWTSITCSVQVPSDIPVRLSGRSLHYSDSSSRREDQMLATGKCVCVCVRSQSGSCDIIRIQSKHLFYGWL